MRTEWGTGGGTVISCETCRPLDEQKRVPVKKECIAEGRREEMLMRVKMELAVSISTSCLKNVDGQMSVAGHWDDVLLTPPTLDRLPTSDGRVRGAAIVRDREQR